MTRPFLALGLSLLVLSMCGILAEAQAPPQPATPLTARAEFLGKNAGQWLEGLNSTDAKVRRNAAFALGKMGGGADMAVAQLAGLVKSDANDEVRDAAAFALGEISQGGRGLIGPAVTALTGALGNDRNPLVRRSAAYAMGNLGTGSPEIQQALEKALVDGNPAVRQNVAWALGHVGPTAVNALRKALSDGDSLVCRDAAGAVGRLGKEGHAAVRELITCCAPGRDPELRKMALTTLVKLVEPADKIAVQTLVQCLNDRDNEIKRNAALTLSNIGGPDAAAAIPVLLDALRSDDLELKRQAAAAFKNIGKNAAAALPALRAALDDPDEELRMNAAVALGGLAETAGPAVLDLVRHLADQKESPKVRTEAAVALSRIGPVQDAVNSVPTLLRVLGNATDDAKVRERTMWTLRVHQGNLRNLNVFPTFEKILGEPRLKDTRMLRYDCAYMLGLFLEKEAPKVTLDVLQEFLKDNSILIYTGTTAKTGGAGKEVVGKTGIVEEGLGDGRVMAIAALDRIGPERVLARQDIIQQLQFLASDAKTLPDMRAKTKELLAKLGK